MKVDSACEHVVEYFDVNYSETVCVSGTLCLIATKRSKDALKGVIELEKLKLDDSHESHNFVTAESRVVSD